MRQTLWLAVAVAASTIATPSAQLQTGQNPQANVILLDAHGAIAGKATLSNTPRGVTMHLSLTGVPPGIHGIHLHAVGRCDAPDFESAGGHFNPSKKQHGKDNPAGMHAGDMLNVTVPASGALETDVLLSNVGMGAGPTTIFDADGTALVLHATADDYKTDPSGNSGARIACGVVKRVG